jgi:hypothetical protein
VLERVDVLVGWSPVAGNAKLPFIFATDWFEV